MVPATRAAAIASYLALAASCGSKTTLTTPDDDPFVSDDWAGPGTDDPTRGVVDDEPAGDEGGGDEPTGPAPGQPGGSGGRSPGGPGRMGTPPADRIPPGQADELCDDICSLVAHPCGGVQDPEPCWEQCAAMVDGARQCPPLQELLFCYEDASFELDPCRADLGPALATFCAEPIQAVLARCPDALPDRAR